MRQKGVVVGGGGYSTVQETGKVYNDRSFRSGISNPRPFFVIGNVLIRKVECQNLNAEFVVEQPLPLLVIGFKERCANSTDLILTGQFTFESATATPTTPYQLPDNANQYAGSAKLVLDAPPSTTDAALTLRSNHHRP